MAYEIRKNVPLPDKRSCSKEKYGFSRMAVGDSIVIADKKRATVQSLARVAGRCLGRKFAVRLLDDGTLGVWRVA